MRTVLPFRSSGDNWSNFKNKHYFYSSLAELYFADELAVASSCPCWNIQEYLPVYVLYVWRSDRVRM